MTHLAITSYGRNTLRRVRSELRLIDRVSDTPAGRCVGAGPGLADAHTDRPTTSRTSASPTWSRSPRCRPPRSCAPCTTWPPRSTRSHDSGFAHGDLRASTVYVLPDGRAALARPDAPRAVKRNGRGRARQDDSHAFAVLAAELLADPPEAAADRARGRPEGRPQQAARPARPDGGSRRDPRGGLAVQQPAPIARPSGRSPSRPSTCPMRRSRTPGRPPPRSSASGPGPPRCPRRSRPLPPRRPRSAAPSRARFIPDGVEERQRRRPPKRERTLFRRIMEPVVVLLGLATVAAGGGGGA